MRLILELDVKRVAVNNSYLTAYDVLGFELCAIFKNGVVIEKSGFIGVDGFFIGVNFVEVFLCSGLTVRFFGSCSVRGELAGFFGGLFT